MTRCRIGYLREDKKIQSIICWTGGSKEEVGVILNTYYTDLDTVKRLCNLGDIEKLGKFPKINNKQVSAWDIRRVDEKTNFYLDDYCENENYSWDSTPKESKTIKELRELTQRCDCDHTFLFKDGKWRYYAY